MIVIPKYYSGLEIRDYIIYLRYFFKFNKESLSIEKIWSKFFPNKQLIPTSTGRDGLWYFLESADLKEGSQVLIPAFNLYVIVRIIIQKGLIPVFVDIEKDTLCMDPTDLARKINNKAKLVVVTHMFGNPANILKIKTICDKHNILLFEDCAHAVGTKVGSKQVGGFGDGALFSFGIYKLINTFGGGLLVMTKRLKFKGYSPSSKSISSFMDNFTRFIFSLLFHPSLYWILLGPFLNFTKKRIPNLYHVIYPSKDNPEYRFNSSTRAPYKSFMTEMCFEQMKRLKSNILSRRAIASSIKEGLENIDQVNFLNEDKYGKSNFSYFGVYVNDSNSLSAYLLRNRIETGVEEYCDCSVLPQFSRYKSQNPNSLYATDHLLRLPNFLGMREKEVNRLIKDIKDYYVER